MSPAARGELATRVIATVPATTANLGPGFDVVGLALSIRNRVEMTQLDAAWHLAGHSGQPARSERPDGARRPGLVIEIKGHDGGLPHDRENLVFKAAKRLFEHVDLKVPPLRIRLFNRIPLARGLGSSAAAIVGGMAAANAMIGGPLDRHEVFRLAAEMEGHPDNVAAAVFGGLTVSYRTDGGPSCAVLRPHRELAVALLVPSSTLETSEARALLPGTVPRDDAVFNLGRLALLLSALTEGRFELLREATEDRLHQPYRELLLPGFGEIVSSLRGLDSVGVALSGAGPSIVCLASGKLKELERRVSSVLAGWASSYEIRVVRPDRDGVRVKVEP